MALAPIVTIMLGASIDRNSGNERVFVKRYAKNSTALFHYFSHNKTTHL
ncbi:MAG: hypothetical protein QXD42_01105 [Nitrososphaerales archaeon]